LGEAVKRYLKTMGSSYTNTTRKHVKGRKPAKSQKLVKLTVYLGAICISLAAIATIVGYIRSGDTVTTEIELPHGTLSKLTHIETFTLAYLSVNCNAALLETTQTIR
jgi:hypothetical protein